MNCVIDTDVLINHLRGYKNIKPIIKSHDVFMSIITYGELLTGAIKSYNSKVKTQEIKDIISDFEIIILPINTIIIEKYAELRSKLEKRGNRVDDFDLLIASTAIALNSTVCTENIKHFSKIDGIKILEF